MAKPDLLTTKVLSFGIIPTAPPAFKNGGNKAFRPPRMILALNDSAILRDQLTTALAGFAEISALTEWAQRS
jgi:hypothetical protein